MKHTMKHTPGPWKVLSDPCHFDTLSSIVGGKDEGKKQHPQWKLMAEVGGNADWREQEANTRLMAAAPDLLEALQVLLAEFEYQSTLGNFDDNRVEMTIAANAIAKATGDQP